jgi:hypothetical protein
MGNWFADRLGAPVVARYQPGQPWPPQQGVAPPQQVPQQYVQYQPQGQPVPFDPSSVRIDDIAQFLALKDAWRGTMEEKTGTATCPKCGGPLQMYTGLNAPKIMNRDGVSCHPMERCHYCGYNGHFEQLGQQATDSGVPMRVI